MSPLTVQAIESVRDVLEDKASRIFMGRVVAALEEADGDADRMRDALLRVGKMAALFIGDAEVKVHITADAQLELGGGRAGDEAGGDERRAPQEKLLHSVTSRVSGRLAPDMYTQSLVPGVQHCPVTPWNQSP